MKKFYSIISLLAGLFALTACTPEVDEIFSGGETDRVEASALDYKEILMSAKNGWRMEYYGATTYGGYNVIVKFDEYTVTVASEKVGANHNAGFGADGKLITCTSRYKLENSQGIVLSFDDYNDIFHYFSTPNNPDYGTDGDGMEGDFEFRIISVTPEKVEMTGKKTDTKIIMYPLPEDQTWENYINEVHNTEEFMVSRSYQFVVEGSEREISAVTSYRRLVFTYTDDRGDSKQVVAPFIVTPDGYKMYKTVDVDGTEIPAILKGDTEEFFLVEGNEKARLYTYVPTLKETLEGGMWFITYEDLGNFARPYWDEMREKLKTAGPNGTKNRLYWALIGTYQKHTALHIQAGGDYCYQGMSVEALNEEGNEVRIKWNSSVQNAAGKKYYKSYGLNRAIIPFMIQGSKGRSFELTTDNRRHPSYIILKDKDEPSNVIKLWADQKNYPYGDLDADDK